MAGSLLTILSSSDPITIPGSVISALLLAVGMLGLRARYGERAGSLGRNMLLLGMLGPFLWVIVIASMAFMYSSGSIPTTSLILYIPFRRGEKWAWYSTWIQVIVFASAIFFGAPEITMKYSVIAGLMALCLLLTGPAFFQKET